MTMGSARRLASIALVAAALGCASAPALQDGAYRDPSRGWKIAVLPEGWSRTEVEDVALAFVDSGGASIGVTDRCENVSGTAEALARQLRAGLGSHRVIEEQELEVAGAPAVRQVLELDGAHVAAVTRAAPPCVQDFVLVAREGFEDALPIFDAWWGTFVAAEAPR